MDLGKLFEETLEKVVDRVLERKLGQQRESAPALLDRRGIAKALGVHPNTVDNWRGLGMPCVRVSPGAEPRYIVADCIEWARTRSHNGTR